MSHLDQGPANDPNWRERFGMKPERPDTDYNGGLEGGVTPPMFTSGAKMEVDKRDYSRKTFIDWRWLRIESHYGLHFDEREMAIELRLPWRSEFAFNHPFGKPLKITRSLVLVFGRIHTRLIRHAWHARIALDYWTSPDWL